MRTQKLYYFGARYSGVNCDKVQSFCTKNKGKIPKSIIVLKSAVDYIEKIHNMSEELVRNVLPGQLILSKEEINIILGGEITDPIQINKPIDPELEELKPGSVVIHEDSGGHHFAIILKIKDSYADVLFLSSKGIGRQYRQATKDELALMGYVYSKKTYLCLVTRPVYELYSKKLDFPEYRVQDLIQEFINK